MQQKQPDRLYPGYQQPTTYRFASNRPENFQANQAEAGDHSAQKKHSKEKHKTKERKGRIRIFTWWNLFAVIGIITVIIQTIRYVVVPLLVMLNSLMGGAL